MLIYKGHATACAFVPTTNRLQSSLWRADKKGIRHEGSCTSGSGRLGCDRHRRVLAYRLLWRTGRLDIGVNLDRVTGIQRELGGARDLAKVDEGADLTSIDYTEPARDYMRSGGMTDEQIDAFVARLKQ